LYLKCYAIDVEVLDEKIAELGVVFKVDVNVFWECFFGKFLHKPSLAHLTCALQNQGFAVGLVFPSVKVFYGVSFHSGFAFFVTAKLSNYFHKNKNSA
jgi:hypothetical protein